MAMDIVMPIATPLFACMPLACPEPGAGGYDEMGVCTLMINIGLGSIAPMLPLIDIMTGLPDSIGDLPPDLMGLPFAGLTVPPLPIPAPFNLSIGNLEMPSWPGVDLPGLPPLLDLLFGLITIPFKIIEGLALFQPPELPLLDFVLGQVLLVLQLPGVDLPMLPDLGLLQLAICILALLLLPFIMLGEALAAAKPGDDGPLDEAFMAPLAPIAFLFDLPAELAEMFTDDMQPTDKLKEKVNDAYAAAVKKEKEEKAAEERRARAAAGDGDDDGDKGDSEWKPSIKDYYYG